MAPPLDVRTLEKIARSSRPGVLLRLALRQLRRRRRSEDQASTYQRSLPVIVDAPAEGPLREWDRVPCRLHPPGSKPPLLLVKACLNRRADAWPSGDRKGKPKHLECVGCALGASYAARLPGYEPPPASQAPEVLPPKQRAAKAKWQATRPDEGCERDPLRIAAEMTPDDKDEWK